ncbi:MAG TPA: energy-coupling factor transporter ATPase [Ruminiclostridium sp.]|jgi:energy-coupling factor transport system ATP-binding protein|nr:energy-coupling factor transporter ATPase [Clostridiaceae bacterium]HAA25402.1 energy-coupling factor transporter ATPase [Ruminiclostridium sp.]
MEAIIVKDLKYEYYTRGESQPVIALDEISFTVSEGEFIAVVGKNGSGKSTLAKHLNGLLLPAGGSVCVFGRYTDAQELIWDIRRILGMVFQNPDNQLVATTVEEDIAFGPENLGIEPEEIRHRVKESLKKVSMEGFDEYSPHMLSGGQKQRIAIAGVLAMHPRCIVLDEATSMLDPEGRKDVMSVLKKLNSEENITIVLITHHMNEAAQADRVIVMDEGKAVLSGKPDEIFGEYRLLRQIGLDIPQVSDLYVRMVNEGLIKNGRIPVLIDEAEQVFTDILSGRKTSAGYGTVTARKTGEKIVEIKNLSYTYMAGTPYERHALRDVSLTVYKGEKLGIIGHTGSGKSTLIQHLNGLLSPTAGTVEVSGIIPEGKSLKELRRKVGLIFQNPEDQLFEETVEKDIAFGLKKMGLSDSEVNRRINEALSITGLPADILKKSPFELSGGQKRRVAIAGVIVMEPDILVLDEPTAGLDPQGSAGIYEFLSRLNESKNTTIIIVSHTMEDIARFCDRVAVMEEGKIIMVEETRSVFSNKEYLEKTGLDVPQITELFYRLNKKNQSVRKDILTVQEGLDEMKRIMGI